MATTSAPNPRASLLAGLRTGGVRSASGNVPHTAAPGATFNVPRYAPTNNDSYYLQEEQDELADMMAQNLYIKQTSNRMQQAPMTAAVDGTANRFAHQQGLGINAGVPMSPFMSANQSQLQALQLQMMQAEIARLQAVQVQQYQAELLAQAQRQQQQQQQQLQQQQLQQRQPVRRSSMPFIPPATAGPTNTSFDLRSATMRRAQAEQMRARLGSVGEEQVPMTAALGGKFGSRMISNMFDGEEDDLPTARNVPSTPNYTTVISGGTPLGGSISSASIAPSKSDAAVSWRRNGNNSVLNNARTASAPLVKITPPPSERVSPPPAISPIKTRPQPLRFAAAEPLTSVAIVTNDAADCDDNSSVSSRSNSSPSTPRTASSAGDMPPLSPREEATKKLYEGLGIGRPIPAVTVVAPPAAAPRFVSAPMRQPRGPPSNNDELLPKNFASRSRRKAIGALGALLDARERREVVVEAY
ncbi:hypothetical protein ABKN59_000224 [Abortiporus biennis]